jgi:hypothetical protein
LTQIDPRILELPPPPLEARLEKLALREPAFEKAPPLDPPASKPPARLPASTVTLARRRITAHIVVVAGISPLGFLDALKDFIVVSWFPAYRAAILGGGG